MDAKLTIITRAQSNQSTTTTANTKWKRRLFYAKGEENEPLCVRVRACVHVCTLQHSYWFYLVSLCFFLCVIVFFRSSTSCFNQSGKILQIANTQINSAECIIALLFVCIYQSFIIAKYGPLVYTCWCVFPFFLETENSSRWNWIWNHKYKIEWRNEEREREREKDRSKWN